MLKYGEPNPLNVFGLRKLEHCPPHFVEVKFDLYDNFKSITDWVYENLEGRFYAGDAYAVIDKKIHMSKCIAFENPSEATYFSLFLDKINPKPKWQ